MDPNQGKVVNFFSFLSIHTRIHKLYSFWYFVKNHNLMKVNWKSGLNLLVLILVFSSCSRYEKTFYDSGKLKEKFQVKEEGFKQGKYLRYFENGVLAEETSYQNNEQHGMRKIYFEDGNLEYTAFYVHGLLEGERKVFYPSGKLRVSSTYKQNQLVGPFYKYYENGKLAEEVTFVDGNENGPFVEYYENGVVKWKGNYLNGDHEFGLLEHFDVNGKLIKKMECDSTGMCITIWKDENNTTKG